MSRTTPRYTNTGFLFRSCQLSLFLKRAGTIQNFLSSASHREQISAKAGRFRGFLLSAKTSFRISAQKWNCLSTFEGFLQVTFSQILSNNQNRRASTITSVRKCFSICNPRFAKSYSLNISGRSSHLLNFK